MLEDVRRWASDYFTTERLTLIAHAALILIGGVIFARWSGRWVKSLVGLRGDPQRAELSGRLISWTVLALALSWSLHELGFKLGVLLGAAGLATVAIGFAAQTTLSNLISGFFLFGERPFSVGDTIEMEGIQGEVLSVDMMSTKVRSLDNRYVRIPNEALIKAKLANLTRFPIRRLELKLPIGYGKDFEPLRLHLLEIADRSSLALDEPAPLAFVSGFSDSGFQVELWVWCRTENLIHLRAELGRLIQRALTEREIPPPAVPGASPRGRAAA